MAKTKNKGGKPTVMTPETLLKLEKAFSIGCPDEEACSYAGIGMETLYSYQRKHPEYVKKKEDLRNMPNLAVREMIVKNINKDLNHARWYASKKLRKEFGDKMEMDITGAGILVLPAEIVKKHKK